MALPTEDKYSIVQIIDRLNIGGTERVLITLSNLLYKKGHAVTVLTTVNKGPLATMLYEKISLVELKRKWKWNPATMYRLIKTIKHFDIIHVHSSYNLRYVFFAAKLFGLKKPVFFHEHFGDININQSASWHTKYIYPKTVLIAVSKQIADWAIQQLQMPKESVFVLANTIIKKEKVAEQKNINAAKKLLLVSNFRPTKNILAALAILENLLSKKTDIQLTIIGQVADPVYYDTVLNYIQEHRLQNAIAIRTNETDIQNVLHEFDLALHTATSESGPLVLIEYIAQGLPFITYQTGEVTEQIKNDVPEFIMQSFDVEEWTNRIEEVLQKNRLVMQQKMQLLFDKYYSADAYYEKCISIYRSGLATKKSI